jgi:peroxiredoxin
VTQSGKFLLKILVAVILVLGLLYPVYTNFFLNKETVAKGQDQNQAAYDFTLQDLEGKKISLSDFKGKGVVLNFWATYCPPCEKEMPYLNNVYQEYKEKGIEILAVNAKEPRILVSPFVEEKNISFSILLDRTGTTVDKYQILNLPTTFFIDEDGVIVEKISGELTETKIRSLVERIVPQ